MENREGFSSNKPRVVLDTNVLISAYIFGGKPESVLKLIVSEDVKGVTSKILIGELADVLRKKISVSESDIIEIQNEVEAIFEIVYPTKTLHVLKDVDDNRILEAAVEGKCDYIITGDKELLKLGFFKKIKILNTDQFLDLFQG